ncbi:MAG: DUF5658 family protein [Phycisphaerales bacterium]|jgi:hypothetical protein|nr:DUF5658 family protein [Phycisphaerales bacterium]
MQNPPSVHRARRVQIAVAAIALLALIDLALTAWHASTLGMLEANPLARAVVAHAGVPGLGAFKVLTTGFGLGVLLAFRRRASAEVGAWVCAIALTSVAVIWIPYHAAAVEQGDHLARYHRGEPALLVAR